MMHGECMISICLFYFFFFFGKESVFLFSYYFISFKSPHERKKKRDMSTKIRIETVEAFRKYTQGASFMEQVDQLLTEISVDTKEEENENEPPTPWKGILWKGKDHETLSNEDQAWIHTQRTSLMKQRQNHDILLVDFMRQNMGLYLFEATGWRDGKHDPLRTDVDRERRCTELRDSLSDGDLHFYLRTDQEVCTTSKNLTSREVATVHKAVMPVLHLHKQDSRLHQALFDVLFRNGISPHRHAALGRGQHVVNWWLESTKPLLDQFDFSPMTASSSLPPAAPTTKELESDLSDLTMLGLFVFGFVAIILLGLMAHGVHTNKELSNQQTLNANSFKALRTDFQQRFDTLEKRTGQLEDHVAYWRSMYASLQTSLNITDPVGVMTMMADWGNIRLVQQKEEKDRQEAQQELLRIAARLGKDLTVVPWTSDVVWHSMLWSVQVSLTIFGAASLVVCTYYKLHAFCCGRRPV